MTKSEFIRILRDPSLMSKEHSFDLEDVVSDFPFFQAARVLYLKGLKSQNSFRYNQSLKTTAVYTNERSVLFAFISSNDYNLPSQQKNEQQIINDIVLHDQKVLDQIYKIDYENSMLILYDKLPDIGPDFIKQNMILDNGVRPVIEAAFIFDDKKYKDWFLFDTGNSGLTKG